MNRANLITLLEQGFSLNELGRLSFDMGIPADVVGGDSRPIFAQRLVEFIDRRGDLDDLVARAKLERPNLDWTLLDIPEPELFA